MNGETVPSATGQYLLQCVVEVAMAAFGARASSVFLHDDRTGDLVFEAVAGEGADDLVGTRFAAGTGIAGWVAASGQPIVADDLAESNFAEDAARETGYVPRTIAAAPILREGHCVGVLEVLDRDAGRDELATLELIGLLATQAAAGISLVRQLRRNSEAWSSDSSAPVDNAAVLARIAAELPHLDDENERLVTRVLGVADSISRAASRRSGLDPPMNDRAGTDGDRSAEPGA